MDTKIHPLTWMDFLFHISFKRFAHNLRCEYHIPTIMLWILAARYIYLNYIKSKGKIVLDWPFYKKGSPQQQSIGVN